MSSSWSPACYLAIFPKAVPEGNQRFRGQNQRPSSWGRSPAEPALLARVGRASTNTMCFQVGGSRCGPRPTRLRKTCYHSCDTESVQEPIRFQSFVIFKQQRVTLLFSCEMNLEISIESARSSTVVANQVHVHHFAQYVSIIHWSLSKNMT